MSGVQHFVDIVRWGPWSAAPHGTVRRPVRLPIVTWTLGNLYGVADLLLPKQMRYQTALRSDVVVDCINWILG
jgi:hypothetical protein